MQVNIFHSLALLRLSIFAGWPDWGWVPRKMLDGAMQGLEDV